MGWRNLFSMGAVAVTALALSACAAPSEESSSDLEASDQDLTAMPREALPAWLEGLAWMNWLSDNYPSWYTTSKPSESDAHAWGQGFAPSDPVFAHNEIDIEGVTPQEVLTLMQRGRSDTYYVNSGPALDCNTGDHVTLSLGTEYCWTTFGSVQHMKIVELVDDATESVLAWEGGQLGVNVYHRWIFRATKTGTHVITEECENGILPSIPIYKNKMNPALHAGHELWLVGLRDLLGSKQP